MIFFVYLIIGDDLVENIVYCYNKCSTCRKALKWLDDNKISYVLKDIIISHPSYDEMNEIINKSGKDINKFFNTSGILYRELNVKDKLKTMTYEEKLILLVSDGKLIKRPLLINESQVLNGFKEEEWEYLK